MFREPKKRKKFKVPGYSYERDNLKAGLLPLVMFLSHLLKTTTLEEQASTQENKKFFKSSCSFDIAGKAKKQGTIT